MLYITAALYEEAAPFLTALSLKKDPSFQHFDLFLGDNAMLLLTKTGAMRAAVATSSFLTTFPPQKNDVFLSVGTAACVDQNITCGSAFILQQITDAGSGRSVYPELIYCAPFPEARLTTIPHVITSQNIKMFTPKTYNCNTSPMLYDMESSGIYEAAIPYFLCEQLLFCRIVSDHATDLPLSQSELREKITFCITNHTETIIRWAKNIQENREVPKQLPSKHIALYEHLCAALRLSAASRAELKRIMFYLYLNDIDYLTDMEYLLRSPCKTKKEGLFYLGQLKKHFL